MLLAILSLFGKDGTACVHLTHGLHGSKAAKHFEVRLRFLNELVHNNVIEFARIYTQDQYADSSQKPCWGLHTLCVVNLFYNHQVCDDLAMVCAQIEAYSIYLLMKVICADGSVLILFAYENYLKTYNSDTTYLLPGELISVAYIWLFSLHTYVSPIHDSSKLVSPTNDPSLLSLADEQFDLADDCVVAPLPSRSRPVPVY